MSVFQCKHGLPEQLCPKCDPHRQRVSNRIHGLVGKRNDLIRKLWKNYAETLDADRERKWKDEDMDLWMAVTQHSAIQDRLSNDKVSRERSE